MKFEDLCADTFPCKMQQHLCFFASCFFTVDFHGWLCVQVVEVTLVSSLLVYEALLWSETCDL